ncbi:DUF1501 domain-containing protein [Pseudophaeobacter flagellatus]|uniref:DUF1501 domain-containing protein n=1 Tax=Pseudophaeobacter flagellatus TaxID=2899119 RepID=UPI001E389C9D|nr:DUF1501 domain-containing protein [Pseudophaeobacter flagellatus]MCD9149520.1 DUF1501 domain-containing protein [Pseudophaeobacter flagellatus]
MTLSRRKFLARSGLLGCSLAASPLITPVSFAAAPWDRRLVVIILRGGMDGLDVLRPYGDPGFAGLRPGLLQAKSMDAAGGLDLDGFFAMHPALAPLMPLWQQQELGFVQAVSTPYRDRRSHFDGQDLLEAGTIGLGERRDGWLNRLLQVQTGVVARTAFAIGNGDLRLLQGAAPVSDWSPDADLALSPQAEQLARLMMQQDPLFSAALAEALALSRDGAAAAPVVGEEAADMMSDMGAGVMEMPRPAPGKPHVKLASFAAEQLRGDTRIASFSLNGWDTHNRQNATLKPALTRLSDCILTLKQEVGATVWDKTAVVAMTEFGRTVRENGTGGTDHGTGGAMLLAGGAIRGGRVYGRWPGLDEAALYNRRDLMPTGDVREATAWIMRGLTATGQRDLETTVFPGLKMGQDPGFLR